MCTTLDVATALGQIARKKPHGPNASSPPSHGTAGVVAAPLAGGHTIEHGSFLTEEACDLMIEQGAILVPTRYVIETLMHLITASGLRCGRFQV